jgi:hypothetical protein
MNDRSFWQSRMTVGGQVAPLPDLTDLAQLAAEIRARHKQVRDKFTTAMHLDAIARMPYRVRRGIK